jgi:hypothetical protein
MFGGHARLVDVADFQRVPARAHVRDHLEDHALQGRLLSPVILAPLDDDLLARLAPDQPVWPAADGGGVVVTAEIALRVDVLRQHEHVVEANELRRQRLAEPHFDRVLANRAGPGQVEMLERGDDLQGLRLRVEDLPEREDDVARAHGLSVRERGFFVELEPIELAVFEHFPRVGQSGDGLQLLVEVDQGREEVVSDLPVIRGGVDGGVERDDVALQTADERPALLRRPRVGDGRFPCRGRLDARFVAEAGDADEQRQDCGGPATHEQQL